MTTISKHKKVFTVVTRTRFKPEARETVIGLLDKVFPIFKKQPGLVFISAHHSHDETETMTYLQWLTKTHHEACMASEDFAEFNTEWGKLLESGDIEFSLQTYDVIDAYEA